jgi:hypothetical protein
MDSYYTMGGREKFQTILSQHLPRANGTLSLRAGLHRPPFIQPGIAS